MTIKKWLRKYRKMPKVIKIMFACRFYIMVSLVQGFESFLLVMVKVMEVRVFIDEEGVSNIAIYFQASLCSHFIIILF